MRGRRIGTGLLCVLLAVVVATSCYAAYARVTPAELFGVGESRTTADGATDIPPETTRSDEETESAGSEEFERTATAPEKTAVAETTIANEEQQPDELVTAVGDSAMLGAFDALWAEVPSLALVDAEGSRQAAATVDLLRQYRDNSRLGDVVVVHVGNNGPITAEEFDEMMGELQDARKVLVVNLTVPPNVPDPIAIPNDAVLAEGVRRYPDKAVLVDWRAASAGHPDYFWDGIHLTPDGAQAYAELIASQVGELEGSGDTPEPGEAFTWGDKGASGTCVGPTAWCLEIVRR